ncbi:hypothetical protein ACM66B_000719 [Microbotryomycetes sp. NB124-2]
MLIYKRSASPQIKDYDNIVIDDDDDIDMLGIPSSDAAAVTTSPVATVRKPAKAQAASQRRTSAGSQPGSRLDASTTTRKRPRDQLEPVNTSKAQPKSVHAVPTPSLSPKAQTSNLQARQPARRKPQQQPAADRPGEVGKNERQHGHSQFNSAIGKERPQAQQKPRQSPRAAPPPSSSRRKQRQQPLEEDDRIEELEQEETTRLPPPRKRLPSGTAVPLEKRRGSPPKPPDAISKRHQPSSEPRSSKDKTVELPTEEDAPTSDAADSDEIVPTVAEFIASLPIPLDHLVPSFTALGLSTPTDLIALASDTEAGRNARKIILDQVDQQSDKGLTVWQRVVFEEQLKSRRKKWCLSCEEMMDSSSTTPAESKTDWLDAVAAPQVHDHKFAF